MAQIRSGNYRTFIISQLAYLCYNSDTTLRYHNSSLRNDCILKAFKLRVRCKSGHERSECPKYLTSSLMAEYNRCVHYFIYDQQYIKNN